MVVIFTDVIRSTEKDPSDLDTICGDNASQVQEAIASICGNNADAAQSAFSSTCAGAGKTVCMFTVVTALGITLTSSFF